METSVNYIDNSGARPQDGVPARERRSSRAIRKSPSYRDTIARTRARRFGVMPPEIAKMTTPDGTIVDALNALADTLNQTAARLDAIGRSWMLCICEATGTPRRAAHGARLARCGANRAGENVSVR